MLVNSEGHEPRYPHPNGLSGCGVWRLTPKPASEWTINDRKLIGVEHTHGNRKEQLIATRIEPVIALLGTGYPDLVPAIEKELKLSDPR
jgi:hypothetical protein